MADSPDNRARETLRDWEDGRQALGMTLSHCQQVSRYLYPDRSDFQGERSPGQKRMQYVYDATPLFAHEMAAAGLHDMATSDTLPWFMTAADDERLMQNQEVRAWFAAADIADYAVFNSPRLNFNSQSHQVYLDWSGFGTACMAALPGDNGATLFSTRHLKELVMFENEQDRIDHLVRRWQWTADKAVKQWGPAAGAKANKLVADGNGQEKLWFLHRVKPRTDRDPQRADARHKPFESLYVAEADMAVISETGFDIFPYLTPRLGKIPSETWGRGRGMLLYPTIRMLNEAVRIWIRGAEKQIDPPLMLPDDGFIVPIKTAPGSLNYYRTGIRPTDRIAPILTQGNPQIALEMIQALREIIKEGFWVNLLITPTDPQDPGSAGKGVTATFTNRQRAENMRQLSSVNAQLSAEWTAPVVETVRYYQFQRARALRFGPGSPYPPPPEILRGQAWHAEFKSPVALAQRAAELTAIDQLMQRQVQLKTIDPQAPMIFHDERLLQLEARDLNVPIAVLKTARELAEERATMARMAQQQHDAEVNQGQAGALADLAKARDTQARQAQMRLAA